MKKRIISFILAAAIGGGLFAAMPMSAVAAVSDGVPQTGYTETATRGQGIVAIMRLIMRLYDDMISGSARIINIALEPADGFVPTPEQMDTVKTVVENRLDAQGILDHNVTIDDAGLRILVEIPYGSLNGASALLASDTEQPKAVVDYLCSMAHLTFRPYDPTDIDAETGEVNMSDVILLEGVHVTDARAEVEDGPNFVVALTFDAEGTRQFADMTTQYMNRQIAIYLDDTLLMAPTVAATITNGQAIITGSYTPEEANMYAAKISSGQLPYKLTGHVLETGN